MRRETPSFKQNAVKWNQRTSTVRFSIPRDIHGKQFLYLKIRLPEGIRLTENNIQLTRLIYHNGDWSAHFVYSITLPELKGVGETMVIDLGMTNLAASACTDRTTVLWLGGELAAL
ncbi:MAG: hypothetical protein ACM30F_05755 [Nitrospirota bacterium]